MSADYKARSFVLKVQNAGSPSGYDTLGSLVDCNLTIQDAPDDTTSKGSAGARELYIDGAVKAYDFSGNLVVTSETAYATLLAAKTSATPRVSAKVVGAINTYTGTFVIESLNEAGGNAGRVRGSIDLKSSGAITVTAT